MTDERETAGPVPGCRVAPMTPRENRQREALRLLRAGYSHREIAEQLGVHRRTAEIYTAAAREREQRPSRLADVRR